ncbi:hypothetical protein D3C76_914110 [compost metagenome]
MTFTPPTTVNEAYSAVFEYKVKDARDGVSKLAANVSVAVTPAAVEVDQNLKVISASVTVRSNSRYAWELVGTSAMKIGETLAVTASTNNGVVRWQLAAVCQHHWQRAFAKPDGNDQAA